jgi:hypothetical protein
MTLAEDATQERREAMKAAGSKQLARREFLLIGSKAVILTAAGTLVNPKALFAAATTASPFAPLLSIGYAPSVPGGNGAVALGSAESILTPDPLFISRGARVTILGSDRAPSRRNAAGSLFLDALFPSKSGAENENRRFRFWSMTGRPDHDSVSGNLSFRIPVLATTGISFMARYRRPNVSSPADATAVPPIEEDNAPFTLSLGRAAGPNLRPGVYVVALRETADQTGVSWDRLRLIDSGDRVAVQGAMFSYVVVEIEYGDEKRRRRTIA